MRVAILFDDVASRAGSTPDEQGVMEAVSGVESALSSLGHSAVRVPAGSKLEAWTLALRASSPDLVFNLCEGLGGRSEGEVLAARAVEEMGIPMTGSSSATLARARRKDRVNALLEGRGLPVPAWGVWDGFDRLAWAARWESFPAIVKPAAEDGSVGITQASVVEDQEELARQMEAAAPFAPLLIQSFVGTREINVGVVGKEVLPLAEIAFDGLPTGLRPMVGYEAKWSPGSPEDRGTVPVCPATLPPQVEEPARALALEAWEAVGGVGYGRVDLRFTEPDSLHLLEVNPNPDMAPGAGLARMGRAHGWTYAELVVRILAEAKARPAPGTQGARWTGTGTEVTE